MRHDFRLFLTLNFTVVLVLLATSPFLASDPPKDDAEEPSVWSQVLELYEKAKSTGEQVPLDVYDWVRQDLGGIGAWEYLVIDLSMSDAEAVQKRLNELGAERWECIWIHAAGKKTSFLFKRPSRSYLKNIPLSQLMKLLPTGDSGGSSE